MFLGRHSALLAPLKLSPATVSVADLNNGSTAVGMAQSLAGAGVSISNVTYTGANRAAGMFTGGASSIGFDSGIVLDTGAVQTYATDPACSQGVEGPNTCYEATGGNPSGPSGGANSTSFGNPGDPDLTALSGFPTFDASVLEFDFVPQHSTVQFSYVFSSEEYSDYANTPFNDVFGFFVNKQNCALVPGTNQAVSVNTINNGNDVGGDPTPHNPQFFRDNVRPSPSINTQMDGLTTILTCTATVTAGQTNHMKLAIADASDGILDSAVFIQAGSLISGTVLNTSLSGAGQSGATITVPTSTAVTDSATLSGANASAATGMVSYKVYSDAACTNQVADAGTKTVASGTVPNSDPVTLNTAGTYYWQATYSGDANNNGSTTLCGSETVTVTTPVGPPTATIVTPPNGATYNLAQVVDASYSCADATGGPGIASCTGPVPNGSPIDTSTVGPHTFTVTATSLDGQTGTATANYTVLGPPTATITTPPNGATYNQGQVVNASYSCTDAAGGPGIASCTGPVPNGSPIDTSTVGPHTFTVTATSLDGQTGTATATYTVTATTTGCRMSGEGFFGTHPVDSVSARLSSDLTKSQHLRFVLSGRTFVLSTLTSAVCQKEPGLNPGPGHIFNSLKGAGSGTYGGASGFTVKFELSDGGQNGAGNGGGLDRVTVRLFNSQGALVVSARARLNSTRLPHGGQPNLVETDGS